MLPLIPIAIAAAALGGGWLAFSDRQYRKQVDESHRENWEKLCQQWNDVNHSPWWIWGIPNRVSLVLDFDVFADKSRMMSFWFKMIQDNAEERDWNVVVLPGVYKRIESGESKRAARRLSNLQDRLGNRLCIIPRAKGLFSFKDDITNYLSQEKTRDDIFFTNSAASKVAIVEHARRIGLDLVHEVRSPENRKRHAHYWGLYYPYLTDYSPYVLRDIDKYAANHTIHLRDTGLGADDREELKRFVDWKVIKLNIVD